ncbi:Nucleotidyltransferase [Cutaneotrichosporon oleaginosum]|uniref:DNA polymerase n=1 Tax=Cutaneotrichosporon oleaginosum TaxID=879819 RepID=A0A0J0XWM3_9TREE|nr:Nucleotidyltransferase [Cutaneotrichosporon oleaginosum]KLT45462.1 Nucleotidyltransferase [Cutaneotrichosporon oleaginosum]
MYRPPLTHHATSSSSGRQPSFEGPPLVPLLAEIPVFVVPAKLDMIEVVSQIEALGGVRALRPEEAVMVITALRGRPRLARVLGDAVDTVAVLRAEFVADAYELAKRAVGDEIPPSLPKWDEYRVPLRRRTASVEPVTPTTPPASIHPVHAGTKRSPPKSPDSPPSKRIKTVSPRTPRISHGTEPATDDAPASPNLDLDTDVTLYPEDIRLRDIPRLAIERPSPLKCPNQDILEAIKSIYLEREYGELAQLNTNVLSYRRSMAILKSVPRRIRSGEEARKLVDVGAKVANRIDEYLKTGQIAEAEEIKASSRFQALRLFSSVWSVGHSTAAALWREGCRDLEDVRLYFLRTDPAPQLEEDDSGWGHGYEWDRATAREERAKNRRRENGKMTREEVVGAWLGLKDELDRPIPRDEVQEIGDIVAEHLDALAPGCSQTITGGYRRGKETTSDVDVVFRPPFGQHENETGALIDALRRRLLRFGIITHVLQLSERETGTPLHHGGGNFDNLDKAFVILRLPGKGRLHRRVDLICSPPSRYAAAVLSWSGSMMFERDLRRWCEDRGYKFRAGLVEIATNREINLDSEREIFRFLGLRYVPPELRNADV